MTEQDRLDYLNFSCGYLLGTLILVRDRISPEQRAHVDKCLDTVNPLILKIYHFQSSYGTETHQQSPPQS